MVDESKDTVKDGSAQGASPSAVGAPCVEYGWLECPPNWHEAINSAETFAALVAEHQAWRAWYITKEAGAPKAQLLAEAVIKAFHAAQAMSRAQVSSLSSQPSNRREG